MTLQRFSYVFGGVYLVLGIVGFFLTGLAGFTTTEGETLILFDVNPLHNFTHLIVGAVWLAAATKDSTAKLVSLGIGGVLVALGLIGFFLVGTGANVLALNHPDNVLHIATGALALFFGVTAEGGSRSAQP
jgi:hypothetical protein